MQLMEHVENSDYENTFTSGAKIIVFAYLIYWSHVCSPPQLTVLGRMNHKLMTTRQS